jgi:hypothetical protein
LKHNKKSADLEEIELNFDASFQQILGLDIEILWEARSTPTLADSDFDKWDTIQQRVWYHGFENYNF